MPEHERGRLSERSARLGPLADNHLEGAGDRILAWRRLLAAYDVSRQLERGYTLTLDGAGAVLRSIGDLTDGAQLTTMFADGSASSRVESVSAQSAGGARARGASDPTGAAPLVVEEER